MGQREAEPPKVPATEKRPWERPIVTEVGTISLLVRGGSAQGKNVAPGDGDMGGNFIPKNS
jgi:hypothetical protein